MGPPRAQPPPLLEESDLLAEEGPPPPARASPAGRGRLIAASLTLAACALAGAGGGALRRPHAASSAGPPLEVTALGESRPGRMLKQRDGHEDDVAVLGSFVVFPEADPEAPRKLLDDKLVEAKQRLAKARARSKEHAKEMERRKKRAAKALKAVKEEQGHVITKARKERDAALKKARMSLKYAEERQDALQADSEMEQEDNVGSAREKYEEAIREKASTLARTKDALAAKAKAEQQIEQIEEQASDTEEVVRRFRKMVKGESYTDPSDEDEEGDDAGDQARSRSLWR